MVGRKKTSFFNEIKLRIINKISIWQANFFSSGGKEILIKAVAQAVPAYAMSIFKLPLGLCEDMQKAIAGFWWGKKRRKDLLTGPSGKDCVKLKRKGEWVFRDLSSFNQALVAKQSWRIIQAPESLIARVMKEKYFKHSGFMEAQSGSNPSYIWRNILWGREVIHKGLRWRIGDGKLVKVYQSGWLPRPETFKPISPPSLPLDTTVSVLIDEDHCWRDDVIQQHFHQEDAAQILKIPLPRQPSPDQVLWHYDKKGNYSVKSGYQLALQMKCPNRPSSSKEGKSSWSSIWYLQIPEKVKIFMWKATNDLLPTSENLWKRRILQTPWCQRCRSHGETIFHTLFDCKASRKIWKLTTFEEKVKALNCKDVLSLLLALADRRSKTEMELIVALCWSIWHSRNLFIFKNKKEDFQLSVARAEAIVQSYKRIQMPQLQAISYQNLASHKHWKCLPAGWFKVNVDAAIKIDNQRVGLGIVIRNSEGKLITAAIKPTKWLDSVDYAEAEATRFGLEVAESAGCLPLIVETDSKEVTDLVSVRKKNKS
ncbi:hypothetical protein AB3S75_019634 [Citrus x aurantiifolia]